ncbi:hypothetical protein Dimus_029680 [Dionaea muscipula]
MGDDMLNTIIETIYVDRDTPGSITEIYLDLPYIIIKKIIRIREAGDDSKALGFGAMLTKIFEAFEVDLVGEEISPTKDPINSIYVTSSKIGERIAARERNRGNLRVDDEVAPPALAAPFAPTPIPVEQIRVRQVHGQVRFDIAHFEERVRESIDELTQLIRRRFSSPSDDP